MGLLNTRLTTATTVQANGLVPVGTVVHKSGCHINASGSAWNLEGAGFFVAEANITVAPVVAGTVIVTMYNNGQAIATATATAEASQIITLPLMAVAYNKCGCAENAITIGINAQAVVSELDVTIEGR